MHKGDMRKGIVACKKVPLLNLTHQLISGEEAR